MKQKKEIKRICCACRQEKKRDELIKITLNSETKELVVNPDTKTFGRSVYLCPTKECYEKAIKKKLILKMLKIIQNNSSKNAVEKIRAVLENIIVLKIY